MIRAPAQIRPFAALAFGLLAMMLAMPAAAAPSRLVADLSDSHVDITSSYHGTDLILFGAYEGAPGDDLVLIVEGPASDIVQRRKEKKAGIWVNVETLVWQEAPSFYHMFATDELASIADEAALRAAEVGPLAKGLMLVAGEAAPGNPFADRGTPSDQIWSYGHRNALGLQFDAQGRLWDLEHGPAGGDELNLVERGANYGWPVVSNGEHYNGDPIPAHATRPEFRAPAIGWTPVIAPGDFLFYSGRLWPEWEGQAIIAAMKPAGIVRVAIDGESAREVARIPSENRIREIVEGPDGALWILEDGDGRLIRIAPA